MEVKEHYDKHLGNFYSWMLGNLDPKINDFKRLLVEEEIKPSGTKIAIDLGAGNGIQSIALNELGYEVIAIDFNERLLSELVANERAKGVKTICADIRNISDYKNLSPEMIVCCGDTLTHLNDKDQVFQLIDDSYAALAKEGILVFTFRDYSDKLPDSQRFIPVKSTSDRILTCILEYQSEKVLVTDLLYEKIKGSWVQKISSYEKVRIATEEILNCIINLGMTIEYSKMTRGMHTLIAKKGIK